MSNKTIISLARGYSKLALVLLAFGASAVAVNDARATSIPVTNFSFENPVTASFDVNPVLPGWTYDDNGAGSFDYVQLFDASLPAVGGVTEGSQYLGLYAANVTTHVYQDTGVAWLPDTTYTLSLALGNRTGVTGATSVFGLSIDGSIANIQGTPTTIDTETAIAKPGWSTFSYSFVTGPIAPAGNVFIVVSKLAQSGDSRVQLDNVQLDAEALPVPEPSTFALLGLGLVGYAAKRRHSAKR